LLALAYEGGVKKSGSFEGGKGKSPRGWKPTERYDG